MTEAETKKAVAHSKDIILGKWAGIIRSMRSADKCVGCSNEGHVSHVSSDRMGSGPLGLCLTGVDKMARLIIYLQNKRDIIKLVIYI